MEYTKSFDCMDHNKLEISERDGNTRPPDLPPEKPVCTSRSDIRTGHRTIDWFQMGKGFVKVVYCHPVYLTYKQSAGLDEAQAGIKIARRNINNLRYADDTTLMAESEEELESLLLKVKKEREKLA